MSKNMSKQDVSVAQLRKCIALVWCNIWNSG